MQPLRAGAHAHTQRLRGKLCAAGPNGDASVLSSLLALEDSPLKCVGTGKDAPIFEKQTPFKLMMVTNAAKAGQISKDIKARLKTCARVQLSFD